MPRHASRLSSAVEDFLAHRRANGYAANTVRSSTRVLHRLVDHLGNVGLDSIEPRHIDSYFAANADVWNPSTRNLAQSHLATFFGWARASRIMNRDSDPLLTTRRQRVVRANRYRVPVGEFPRLLDSAANPRDRMVCALGLFLFLRAGEISSLRISDLRLPVDELLVTVHKAGGEQDSMPIATPLRRELNRWLTFYTERVGPLQSDYFLVPALRRPPGVYNRESHRLEPQSDYMVPNPTRPFAEPADAVKRALATMGRDTFREGCHTLRRSGARALFDELVDRGYERALETVSSMLHHADMAVTQIYLGLQESRTRRDDLVKGQQMFSRMNPSNVVPLAAVEARRG